jgi:hypothetical protein
MRMIATRDANARIASRCMMQKSDSAKTHIPPAFAQISTIENLVVHAYQNFSHPQRA